MAKSNLQFEQVGKQAQADLETGPDWFMLVEVKSSPKLTTQETSNTTALQ